MVNNSDKSKVFYQNDFHVGGNPWAEIPMSAYEPKDHSVGQRITYLHTIQFSLSNQ
jgi:hypothetical protein